MCCLRLTVAIALILLGGLKVHHAAPGAFADVHLQKPMQDIVLPAWIGQAEAAVGKDQVGGQRLPPLPLLGYVHHSHAALAIPEFKRRSRHTLF